jgi:hypothetical protein
MAVRMRMFVAPLAAALLLFAGSAHAYDCRAFVGGDYRLVARVDSAGDCSACARRAAAANGCARGIREFEFKFMFLGRVHTGTGRCARVRFDHLKEGDPCPSSSRSLSSPSR